MGLKSLAARPSGALFDRLPTWFLGASLFATGAVCSNWIAGGASAALLALNCVLACIGVCALWRRSVCLAESWKEGSLFIERIWKIVTQGAGSAGLVGSDLGEPDADGVYMRKTSTGCHLYLRFAKNSPEYHTWEWSFDKDLWMPASKADYFWTENSGGSLAADKIFIRRLEVERALRAQQPDIPTCTHPPPINLDLSNKEQTRLMKNVPKDFLCPMSLTIMTEPVVSPSGVTYNRSSVEEWINDHHTDPATKGPLMHDNLYPNLALRDMIQAWLVENKFVMT